MAYLDALLLSLQYNFTNFSDNFSEEKQKSIDIESICELLGLVLGSQFRAQVDYLSEYLKVSAASINLNLGQFHMLKMVN